MTFRAANMVTFTLGLLIRHALAVPTVALVPSHATTDHSIVGGEIVVHDLPSRVYLDIFVSGWGFGSPGRLLRIVQVGVMRESLSSGEVGALRTPAVICDGDDDACGPIGPGSKCNVSDAAGTFFCEAGFQNLTRPDWVFGCCSAIAAVNQAGMLFGATPFLGPSVVDDGTPRYLGTLALEVPIHAAGTFEIRLDRGENTFFADQQTVLIQIDDFRDAMVRIDAAAACCGPGGVCDDLPADECMDAGGVPVAGARCDDVAAGGGACPSDCDGNGVYDPVDAEAFDCNENRIPDVCEAKPPKNQVIASVPAAGASLPRSRGNIILLSFACETTSPPPEAIWVRRLFSNGALGPDLAPQFSITRVIDSEGRDSRLVMRATPFSTTLVDKAWYSVRSVNGWDDVEPFEVHFPVLVGDVDGNLFRSNADVLQINAAVLSIADALDRRDIDGNGVINNADVLFVNALGIARMPPKPSGH